MMKAVGLQFSVVPSNVDEDEIKKGYGLTVKGYEGLAAALAQAKALSVAKDYPDYLTIGADQLCVLDGTIFDKPGSIAKAEEQLQQLAGKTHQQISAVSIARGDELIWQHQEVAQLTMRALSIGEIEAYVAADQPLKSCGSYKYESLGKHLFERVVGNDDVIKGLPLQALVYQLHRMNAMTLSD